MESMACELEMPLGYQRNDFDLDTFCVRLAKDLEEILVRVEHQDRNLIFDTWEVSRKNEELIYKATSNELEKLTLKQKAARQGTAQAVRAATKGFDTKSHSTDGTSTSNNV